MVVAVNTTTDGVLSRQSVATKYTHAQSATISMKTTKSTVYLRKSVAENVKHHSRYQTYVLSAKHRLESIFASCAGYGATQVIFTIVIIANCVE